MDNTVARKPVQREREVPWGERESISIDSPQRAKAQFMVNRMYRMPRSFHVPQTLMSWIDCPVTLAIALRIAGF